MTGRHRFRVWPWVVSVVLVATMLVLLAVNGVLTTPSGADAVGRPVGAMDRVPVQVPEGGSVLDATHSPVRSLVYPARTVALTFDDGPDPQWTPQILAVLRKHQVPGTFFVLGGKVVRHPGLVRDIRASGSQVGLHTFTHPDLGAVSPARRLPRAIRNPDRPRRGHRGDLLPRAPALLVGGLVSGQPAVAGSRRVGQARLCHRPVRRGQPGLGTHRPGRDRRAPRSRARCGRRGVCCTTAAATAPQRWPPSTGSSRN